MVTNCRARIVKRLNHIIRKLAFVIIKVHISFAQSDHAVSLLLAVWIR